jgi:hypothetical protein
VKTISHNILCILLISFYFVSLAPVTQVTSRSENADLRGVVHTLQALQASASESTQAFKKSLKYSIKTIQYVAGLQRIIFESHNPLEAKPSSLLTITFRFPCILANTYNLPALISLNLLSFPDPCDFYLSLNFAPEIPPPVIA